MVQARGNRAESEQVMALVHKAVERVTRECVVEVSPADVLDLLKRCREVPRRSAEHFQVKTGPGGVVVVAWTEEVSGDDGETTVNKAPSSPQDAPKEAEAGGKWGEIEKVATDLAASAAKLADDMEELADKVDDGGAF